MQAGIAAAGHELNAAATSSSSRPVATPSTTRPTTCCAAAASRAEATRWLYEQGVRVMGIDAWGWDAPLDKQAAEALRT